MGEQNRFQMQHWRDVGVKRNEVAASDSPRRKSFAMAGGPSRWERRLTMHCNLQEEEEAEAETGNFAFAFL
jgi:hypothetical protein